MKYLLCNSLFFKELCKASAGMVAGFYFAIAGCEIAFPEKCLSVFERLIARASRIRFLSIIAFLIALLYYIAETTRLQWFISILFWVYLFSGIWFASHPQSFISLCKSYSELSPQEKRTLLYSDCTIRTILALLLIYAI